MAKMYTLDGKLLTGAAEIRIGDKVFAADDRVKNVKKILEVTRDDTKSEDVKEAEIIKLAFGKKAAEFTKIAETLSWAAYQKLIEIVIEAVTGQEHKEEDDSKSESDSSGS